MKTACFGLALFILVSSLLDAWLTLWWVSLGWATERNPLLQDLVNRPLDFLVVKMLLTALGVLVLWDHRRQTLAFIGLMLGSVAYAYVLSLHAAGAIWSMWYV